MLENNSFDGRPYKALPAENIKLAPKTELNPIAGNVFFDYAGLTERLKVTKAIEEIARQVVQDNLVLKSNDLSYSKLILSKLLAKFKSKRGLISGFSSKRLLKSVKNFD
ncbi:MAG: hypothetical protein ACO201_04060 [Rickettsiales bacterium]